MIAENCQSSCWAYMFPPSVNSQPHLGWASKVITIVSDFGPITLSLIEIEIWN